MTDDTPTADDLAIDLPWLLSACLEQAARGRHDLGILGSPCLTVAALCRRAIAAEAEARRLRAELARPHDPLHNPLPGPCPAALATLADDGCPHHPGEEDDCA